MTIEVLRPGVLSTLQDLGRYGYQRYGVVVDGAMDEVSHRVANLLVGNDETEATLELTLQGPELRFTRDTLIALAGADMAPQAAGRRVPMYRPVWVGAATRLAFGAAHRGCRTYLSVAGGFAAAPMLGSRSTYLPGAMGGHRGRALRKGDVLRIRRIDDDRFGALKNNLATARPGFCAARWFVAAPTDLHALSPVRAAPGRNWRVFSIDNRRSFFGAAFRIGAQSNRMGYRLDGPEIIPPRRVEIISEAISFGTVQVPPDGRPIVLMADRQTTGGYPKIAEVIGADLPRLAQRRPGEVVRFEQIGLDEAQALLLEREAALRRLREAIRTGGDA
jgi:antagonist of KipI